MLQPKNQVDLFVKPQLDEVKHLFMVEFYMV
jgi:hypothetical protein